jgi:hypothetical protein
MIYRDKAGFYKNIDNRFPAGMLTIKEDTWLLLSLRVKRGCRPIQSLNEILTNVCSFKKQAKKQ